VEDVHCVDGWDRGDELQAADEFCFGVGGAELKGKVSRMISDLGWSARVHGFVLWYLAYLSIGQPVNALGAIRVVVGEDVVRECLLFVKAESRSAELNVVVDELIGRMVGDALRGDLASRFEASLDFHGVGEG
jgi:hypothetical protein